MILFPRESDHSQPKNSQRTLYTHVYNTPYIDQCTDSSTPYVHVCIYADAVPERVYYYYGVSVKSIYK